MKTYYKDESGLCIKRHGEHVYLDDRTLRANLILLTDDLPEVIKALQAIQKAVIREQGEAEDRRKLELWNKGALVK